jgi:hypothetical protein
MMLYFDTSELDQKIDRLEDELETAIEVAFDHGAVDWVRVNYPDYYRKRMAMRVRMNRSQDGQQGRTNEASYRREQRLPSHGRERAQ